jgi:chromosomal replication initiation ATPase DnaA
MLDPARIPALLGSAGAALIDGADETALGDAGERGLLHLYNLLAERGGHLLLLGRTPPARWPIALADLRSRLAALPAVRIDPPDDELLRAIL